MYIRGNRHCVVSATAISGTDAQSAKAMAKVVLPIVFIASLAIGYFLVREALKRTADLAESAAEICRTKDFSSTVGTGRI
ncbi:MAG: hypothetical protein ACLU00_04755 [Mediterraneibacter faecis]